VSLAHDVDAHCCRTYHRDFTCLAAVGPVVDALLHGHDEPKMMTAGVRVGKTDGRALLHRAKDAEKRAQLGLERPGKFDWDDPTYTLAWMFLEVQFRKI
jgi:hypothetical protein